MKVINTKNLLGNLKLQLYPCHKNVQFYHKDAFPLCKETKMVTDPHLDICQ